MLHDLPRQQVIQSFIGADAPSCSGPSVCICVISVHLRYCFLFTYRGFVAAAMTAKGGFARLPCIPTYCPHPWSASRPKPIERLWGLMHKHVTHNNCHETFRDFSDAILTFLREEVPRKWRIYCDEVTDNFRIISPKDFRILA